jgi:hypothetical protein
MRIVMQEWFGFSYVESCYGIYAGIGRYSVPLLIIAHAIRAVLLANASAAISGWRVLELRITQVLNRSVLP